jgi:hypothetical protein
MLSPLNLMKEMNCNNCIFKATNYQSDYPVDFCLVESIQEQIDFLGRELDVNLDYKNCDCFIPEVSGEINDEWVNLVPPVVFDVDTEWAYTSYHGHLYSINNKEVLQ